MIKFTDQLKREVIIPSPPKRIISLVPSITELLAALGLADNIAGITKFCVRPREIFKSKPRVGGTKKVDHDKVRELNPDLIIANKEENTRIDVDALASEYPVWVSDVKTLEDAILMIRDLGTITQTSILAGELMDKIESNFTTIKPLDSVRVLYMIWQNPYMVAGHDTFINHMLNRCGFINAAGFGQRYPEIESSDFSKLEPDVVLLSSEPFPFKKKHLEQLKMLHPDTDFILADGEFFSWYGSRLVMAPKYFNKLIAEIKALKTLS